MHDKIKKNKKRFMKICHKDHNTQNPFDFTRWCPDEMIQPPFSPPLQLAVYFFECFSAHEGQKYWTISNQFIPTSSSFIKIAFL